jgi:tripartite-type tricarboxylate transporter receptor subunit TctC
MLGFLLLKRRHLMKLQRRELGALMAGLALSYASGSAWAQTFPIKPVRMVVPYPPGGATDAIARLISGKLATKWAQTLLVENRAGAGTTVAAEFVAKSAPDGYTLYETTATHTVSASLYPKLNYDPIGGFTPITLTATIPLVLVTANNVPARTLEELMKWIKAQPNGVSIASPGNGSVQHLTSELFKLKTGIKGVHIPYKGGSPMVNDLLGGQVNMAFVTLSEVAPHIKAGNIRAIALAHDKRMSFLPDIPTFAEQGMPGFISATWFGTFAPAGLPVELRDRIYRDIADVVALPDVTQALVGMGAEINNLNPQEFSKLINAENIRWAEAVKVSGARVD